MQSDTRRQSVPESTSHDLLHARLLAHTQTLEEKADRLNRRRLEIFGRTETTVIGRTELRTDHKCVPCGMVNVGPFVLLGFNSTLGLRSERHVSDALALFRINQTETGFEAHSVPLESSGFLSDPRFVRDFGELFRYYKDAKLVELERTDSKLPAVFQIGAGENDRKVFRWSVDAAGTVAYLDNRGERDVETPPAFDFEWTAATREMFVGGRNPHVSILDRVFVETIGGDLTVKIENDTETGDGVYREPVDDPHQTLDDADIRFAAFGHLILLNILPFRERTRRYLVFNSNTRTVHRIDAIGQGCLQLPNAHGIVFPGGYCLHSGTVKIFGRADGLEFRRVVKSADGGEVLYVFKKRGEARFVLLSYNAVSRETMVPVECRGWSLSEDGHLLVLKSDSDEAVRNHAVQIWRTPFADDHAPARASKEGTFLEKIGNGEIVRVVSEAMSIRQSVLNIEPSVSLFESLTDAANRLSDGYFWLGHDEAGNLAATLADIKATTRLAIDEFEKTEALKKQLGQSVAAVSDELRRVASRFDSEPPASVADLADAVASVRQIRGRLSTLRQNRYSDASRIDALDADAVALIDRMNRATARFLQSDEALRPLHRRLSELATAIETVRTSAECPPIRSEVEAVAGRLEVLTDIVRTLEFDDPTVGTALLDKLSDVLAELNRVRVRLDAIRQDLLVGEGAREFAARLNLISHAVANSVNGADTPEKCDAALSGLLFQLEDLENKFGESAEFAERLADKRDDVRQAFDAKRQVLIENERRRANALQQTAERLLSVVGRKIETFALPEDLAAFFASDPLTAQIRRGADDLRTDGFTVQAEEITSRLKKTEMEALRRLRDRADLFENGGEVVRLGSRRFAVNTRPFDAVVTLHKERLAVHVTGTDYFRPLSDAELPSMREFQAQALVSETEQVYRGEYLAACLLAEAETRGTVAELHRLKTIEDGLLDAVRTFAASRFDEGYERGIHDADAAHILEAVLELDRTGGLLRYSSPVRAAGRLFWTFHVDAPTRERLRLRAVNALRLRATFGHSALVGRLADELAQAVESWRREIDLELSDGEVRAVGRYVVEELGREPFGFTVGADAVRLRDEFLQELERLGHLEAFTRDARALDADLKTRRQTVRGWIEGWIGTTGAGGFDEQVGTARAGGWVDQVSTARGSGWVVLEEATVMLLTEGKTERRIEAENPMRRIHGLLGSHPRIESGAMTVRLDDFLTRTETFRTERVPAFREFQNRLHELIRREQIRLGLEEFTAKPMSGFVRNRVVDEVYLPLIGDNLAKQIGEIGPDKRTDSSGVLLLISPPGYGKTTLMEYVAARLGTAFVKINGPALGNKVVSLDPAEAPNATARREIERLNFALEMGDNVMLYLDDIQHASPELLEKFISLCDGQRKIEGVVNGEARAFDLRGKRFCVVMAGNPYTESGGKFRIPDMLANRADIFDLGQVLTGKRDAFETSFLENAFTSNPTLARFASLASDDTRSLIRAASGESVNLDRVGHTFTPVEIDDGLAVLKKLMGVRETVLKVNRCYIASASQADEFRSEPPFKLQGSYRTFNKLAEKVLAVTNELELQALIDDHYRNEARTLTTGAEHNLLKLAEIRGRLTPEEAARWTEIKRAFARIHSAEAMVYNHFSDKPKPTLNLRGTL